MFKHLRFRSIRGKLFGGMLLTTLLALVVFSTALIIYDLYDYHQRRVEDLRTQSQLIGLNVIPALQFDDSSVAASTLRALAARPSILSSAVYDANGQIFATYIRDEAMIAGEGSTAVAGNNLPAGEQAQVIEPAPAPAPAPNGNAANGEPAQFPANSEAEGYHIEGTRLKLSRPIAYNGEQIGMIYIEARYELYGRLLNSAGIVLGVALFALALATLLAARVQKQISRPILAITSLARQVAEHRNYSLRAEKLSDDELGYLADAFNALLAQAHTGKAALEASNVRLESEITVRRQANQEIQNLNAQLEERVAARTAELERANHELEAFSYSVSHDLRTPLRAIDGFSQALLEDFYDVLDDAGRDYLDRVRAGAQRMGQLIDDLLKLARVSRAELSYERVNLSAAAEAIVSELRGQEPERNVVVSFSPDLTAYGDPHLLWIVLENLLNNAWKYTGRVADTRIEIGLIHEDGRDCYFVSDNGAGFDMAYAGKLFGAFQRLHEARDYPGTGVGLATVQRIVHRHGGKIWAEAAVNQGATFYFSLPIFQVTDGEEYHT